MSTLATALERITSDKHRKLPALMTHVVLGYPTLEKSIELVIAMSELGVPIIELQIPFSDPMADGPTIMRANEVAIAHGVTPKDCMKAMERLSARVKTPLLFMTYYNIAFRYGNSASGLESFCRDARAVGAEGLIIPDIPPEESADGYWDYCANYGLCPIPLISPVTSDLRMNKIKALSQGGFVYCVAALGTTGARAELDLHLDAYLDRAKKVFELPLAVGFGISTREHLKKIAGAADIAVIGSATIDVMKNAQSKGEISAAAEFIETLLG